jgi:hypothetical protein
LGWVVFSKRLVKARLNAQSPSERVVSPEPDDEDADENEAPGEITG